MISVIFYLLLIQADAVKGQEYNCSMEFDRNCITKVTWKIPEKYSQKGRPFTVSYLLPEGKTENAVLLHYVGYYHCEAAGEHTCDEGNNSTTVSKSTTCVTGRQYMLAADGEPGVSCTPAHSHIEASDSIDNNKQNISNCINGTSTSLDKMKDPATKNTSVKCVSKEDAFQNKENGVSDIVVATVVIIITLTAAGTTYCVWRQHTKIKKSDNDHHAFQTDKEEAEKHMIKEHDNEKKRPVFTLKYISWSIWPRKVVITRSQERTPVCITPDPKRQSECV